MESNKPRPASAAMVAKMSAKLMKLVQNTRVAVVTGDVTKHQGKYEQSGARYFNRIIHLVELDVAADGTLTEQDIRLNCNWNNGIAARLPKGGLKKGDVIFGFDTCDSFYEDGAQQAIFPGKMGVIRHAPTQEEAAKKVRKKSESANAIDIKRVLNLYKKG